MAVIFYGLGSIYSIFLWRRGFRQDDRVCYLLLVVGLCLHMTAMARRGFSFSRCPVNNLYEATLFAEWAMASLCLGLGLIPRFRFLGAFASPILFGMGVFALMPGLDTAGPVVEVKKGFSSLHASLILLSYGAFGLSSVAALMYLRQESDLKRHKLRGVFAWMPPIMRLELVMARLLAAGFVLLTVGLVMGAGWLKHEKGVYFLPDAKIFWSMFVWALYLALLVFRWRFAGGGRRFAWSTLGGFGFILFTFWGFNLLSTIHRP